MKSSTLSIASSSNNRVYDVPSIRHSSDEYDEIPAPPPCPPMPDWQTNKQAMPDPPSSTHSDTMSSMSSPSVSSNSSTDGHGLKRCVALYTYANQNMEESNIPMEEGEEFWIMDEDCVGFEGLEGCVSSPQGLVAPKRKMQILAARGRIPKFWLSQTSGNFFLIVRGKKNVQIALQTKILGLPDDRCRWPTPPGTPFSRRRLRSGLVLLLAFFYRNWKFSIARSFFTRFGQIFFSRLSANNFPTFGQTRICERSERNERNAFYVLHFEKMRFKLLGQTHCSGVCGWIFDFSTLLDSCGWGQLVGAVLKARSARLEKRASLALLRNKRN